MSLSLINDNKNTPSKVQYFKHKVDHIALPERFTFPFAYTPHKLSQIAANELQEYLEKQVDFEFYIEKHSEDSKQPVGKMFGVLVVRYSNGELGYLAAYSGKLANSNHVSFFVPPVFDMLTKEGFFLNEEITLNAINKEIAILTHDTQFAKLQTSLKILREEFNNNSLQLKSVHKARKSERDQIRKLSVALTKEIEQDLIKQSLRDKHEINTLKRDFKNSEEKLLSEIQEFTDRIEIFKNSRKEKSAKLQQRLFESYQFLNAFGATKDLLEIFENYNNTQPPAGAGECCAPKLLQYAYLNQLEPIAMAEFWWGASPTSEIRKHQQFYPSCWGKCHPILSHMLEGLEVEENPLLINQGSETNIEILFEDDSLIILNKPANLLSVPGIHIQDSVYTRLQELYPKQTHPFIVHRLDMGTSGLMVVAKSKEIHKLLQAQFIKRKVEKRYTAILSGEIKVTSGKIQLPLRVDLDDRPRQMVCEMYGKSAETFFEVQEVKNGKTLIHFYPKTGRTHQLRVHAAHPLGLNTPIMGDDLYGIPDERLFLHAEELSFYHPKSREWIRFIKNSDFSL